MPKQVDMVERWTVIRPWLAEHQPAVLARFRPGARPTAIRVTEKAIGRKLPDEYTRFLAIHDGQEERSTMVAWCSLHSVEQVATSYAALRDHFEAHKELYDESPIDTSLVSRGVQRVYWSPGWIPIGVAATGRTYMCLDVDPARGGAAGQVILVATDDDARRHIASSFGELLALFHEQLKSGDLEPHERSVKKRPKKKSAKKKRPSSSKTKAKKSGKKTAKAKR